MLAIYGSVTVASFGAIISTAVTLAVLGKFYKAKIMRGRIFIIADIMAIFSFIAVLSVAETNAAFPPFGLGGSGYVQASRPKATASSIGDFELPAHQRNNSSGGCLDL